MSEQDNIRNHEMVQNIADTLHRIANGEEMPEEGYGHDDDETVSMLDYLENALDFRYVVDSEKNYIAGRVLVAFGGPNIWIDTDTGTVDLYWWGDRATAELSIAARDALDDALNELFYC